MIIILLFLGLAVIILAFFLYRIAISVLANIIGDLFNAHHPKHRADMNSSRYDNFSAEPEKKKQKKEHRRE
jgi:hypothetical protein